MRHATLATTSLVVALSTGFGIAPSKSADLVWQVENPFRFFKRSASFEAQEKAFAGVRGDANAPLPDKVIWKTERRLNDPDCKDATSPTACASTARARYETSRQGWAAQTLDFTCFDRNARPRRYMTTCDRQYSWGTAKADYVLPDAHTVIVSIAPDVLAAIPTGDCNWVWTPRRAGVAGETRKQACKDKLVIKRLPYSNDRNTSGATVKVTLPEGRELADPAVVVEDLFIVAMGDSFMSGEGNPDKPVVFSPTREMVYDPTNSDSRDVASHSVASPSYGVASAGGPTDPKSLPKRRMEDEQKSLIYRPNSREFQDAFDKSGAQWLSTDCHRSQYGYPFRVSLELHRRGPVHRDDGTREVQRAGRRQGGVAAGPAQRPDLPQRVRRADGERLLCVAGLLRRQHVGRQPDGRQALVSAGEPQAAGRSGAVVHRRQRRQLLGARHVRDDEQRRRPRADRRLDRLADPLQPAGVAGLHERARPALQGGQAGAGRRFRHRAWSRAAERLRADPVRRDRRRLRVAAHAGPRRPSQARVQPRPRDRSHQLRAGPAGAARMHRRCAQAGLPVRARS